MNMLAFKPSTDAAIEQLKALGYQDNETVYYRAIGPTTRKIQGTGLTIPPELAKLNADGYGIYLVVNGQGDTDADVTHGWSFFYEHDDLPKDAQAGLWQTLGLPEPTIQIDTGGKSVHSYWTLSDGIPIAEWKNLQSDLLEYADADRSIKNPSRVMRLAGFKHQKTGEVSKIVSNSGKRHSFEELRSIVPKKATQKPVNSSVSKPSKPVTSQNVGDIPLTKCLSKAHRDLIQSGAGEGNRDNAGAALARDLIGTEQHLRSMGQRFEEDARFLFDEYCSRCSPPLDDKDCDRIWNSAEKSNPTPCLSDDKIQGCIGAHYQVKRDKSQAKTIEVNGGTSPFVNIDHNGRPRLVQQSEAAHILKSLWGTELQYRSDLESFWEYSSGKWIEISEILMQKRIQTEINTANVGYSSGYIGGVIRLFKGLQASKPWKTSSKLLPFQNGVLNIETRELLPHSPSHKLTWQLPYEYSVAGTCEPIVDWMRWTQHEDEGRVQVLRAYLKAILLGRSDLQRFLGLEGPGGTGKSTYMNLAIALVGIENTHATGFKALEENRFETALLHGKRFVYITDADRWAGGMGVLKRLTGGDPIPFEKKHKNACPSFVFEGMVGIASNDPIQSTEYTSGLTRRRINIPFTRLVNPADRELLIEVKSSGVTGKFAEMLPGLVNWLLDMPDEEMAAYLLNTDALVPSLAAESRETILDTNPLAAWLEERCIWADGVRTNIGVAKKIQISEGDDIRTSRTEWENSDRWLYANYCEYSVHTGSKPISLRRFGDLLFDLCSAQLKQPNISQGKDRNGSYFEGIALRADSDFSSPRPVTGGGESVKAVVVETPEQVWESIPDCDRPGVSQFVKSINDNGKPPTLETVQHWARTIPTSVRKAGLRYLNSSPNGIPVVEHIAKLAPEFVHVA